MKKTACAVCPSWLSFTLDNIIRKKLHDPRAILGDLVRPGQTVLDLGCGSGYFTIPMAQMTGGGGRVIAADLQEKMLARVSEKARRHNLSGRISLVQCLPDNINVRNKVDFVLTFWMVHEVGDKDKFLSQVASVMKKKAGYLLVEPKMHVSRKLYQSIERAAGSAGFKPVKNIPVPWSRATLFSI